MNRNDTAPQLTVIVPVSETPAELVRLIGEYLVALDGLGRSYEMLIVVDGGQSWVVPQLTDLRERQGEIEIVVLGR